MENDDRIWTLAEQAVVDGDVPTLEALLREHGEMLRTGRVQSTWWGGLAPDDSPADARSIIAKEHDFENWDQFAAHAEALKDANLPLRGSREPSMPSSRATSPRSSACCATTPS